MEEKALLIEFETRDEVRKDWKYDRLGSEDLTWVFDLVNHQAGFQCRYVQLSIGFKVQLSIGFKVRFNILIVVMLVLGNRICSMLPIPVDLASIYSITVKICMKMYADVSAGAIPFIFTVVAKQNIAPASCLLL